MADASRVEDLRPGDHACLTFTDSEERLDLVAAFVRDGLRAGQKVLCVTDLIVGTVCAQLAERDLPVAEATGRGQMSVLTSGETYLEGGSFAAERMIGLLRAEIDRARQEGFAGLWFTGDMCWALRPVTGVEALMTYEEQVARLLAESRSTAVCQYDRQSFDAVTLAGVAARHTRALAATTYHDDGLLRICRQYQPPGVRVTGEIDYRGVEALNRALSESLALDEHVHLNLRGLGFADGSAGGAVVQAAVGMRAGQRMTVRCQAQTGKLLRMLGLDEVPAVTLVVFEDGEGP